MPALALQKLANAFIPHATPAGLANVVAGGSIDRFKQKHGGLWVGGKVTATSQELRFEPNAMNRALHHGLESMSIPLRSIRSVRREFGWLTGIVVVEHAGGEFRFRCFGAKQVAAELASSLAAG